MIAVKEKRRDTDQEDDSPEGAARCAEFCRVSWQAVLRWQHFGDACKILRSYEARRFGLAAWQKV